ncbi:hypothetical protein CH1034_250118 [Klebsiella pneumoniae]|nr:hypothetical protein CH1034_250118 [Klebsiella pneumoniae]
MQYKTGPRRRFYDIIFVYGHFICSHTKYIMCNNKPNKKFKRYNCKNYKQYY